jgi:hypothetical protein
MRNFSWSARPLVGLVALACAADPHRLPEAGDGHVVGSRGDLNAMLLLTDDLDEIQKRWNQPEPPHLYPINAARLGDPVSAVLIFTGCATDAAGVCQLVADYTITDPRGKPFKSDHERPVCLRKPPPPPGMLALGEEAMTATVTAGPLGDYTVSAVVRDRVSGVVIRLTTSFRLH